MSHPLPLAATTIVRKRSHGRVTFSQAMCLSKVSLTQFFAGKVSSVVTPPILSAVRCGVRGSIVRKGCEDLCNTYAHKLGHIHPARAYVYFMITLIFMLSPPPLTFPAHKHTLLFHICFALHNTAHSLRRCWWIRHLQLADKERKWGRAVQRRKEE